MCQSNPDTTDYNPDDVKNGRQTARISRNIPDISAKWQQSQEADFKTLYPKRNANNSETKNKAGDHVL